MDARRTRDGRGAFTLIELLVTLSIAAGLLLVGVGVYYRMNRGFALRSAVSTLESALRGGRTFAVHNRSRVTVVLEAMPADKDDTRADFLIRQAYARGRQTVSCWHFEEEQNLGTEVLGALGQKGALHGGAVIVADSGRIGDALRLNGTDAYLSIDAPHVHGIRGGVALEAYVRPDASATGALPIASKGTAFACWLEYDAALNRFSLHGRVTSASGATEDATPAILVPDEWAHVALAYERDVEGLALKINGREMDLAPSVPDDEDRPLVPNADPLLVGSDGSGYFAGSIDEFQVASLVAGEVRTLPRNAYATVLDGDDLARRDAGGRVVDWRVHFDDAGNLDGARHGKTIRIYAGSQTDDLYRVVTVGWLGHVEVQQVDGRPTE